tara:strand:- start:5588 stop:5788 length:201 start_codon:yes stop_codon:yes gene_type:complete
MKDIKNNNKNFFFVIGFINKNRNKGMYKIKDVLASPEDLITLVETANSDSYTCGKVPYKFKSSEVK